MGGCSMSTGAHHADVAQTVRPDRSMSAHAAVTSPPLQSMHTQLPCSKLAAILDRAWSVPSLEAEVAAAGICLRERRSSQMRVVTWNVWFDTMCAETRQFALLQ